MFWTPPRLRLSTGITKHDELPHSVATRAFCNKMQFQTPPSSIRVVSAMQSPHPSIFWEYLSFALDRYGDDKM
jgi:hypothetical protein